MIRRTDSVIKTPPARLVGERPQLKDKKLSRDVKNEKGFKSVYEGEMKKVTYDKPKVNPDEKAIAALKQESEKAYEQLRQLVEQLLKRQGLSWHKARERGFADITIDETAINEAKSLIADDGLLGPSKTSDRIVQFAIAISGGDRSKYEELKNAIDEGFREVEKMLGGLPEVSQQTYNLVMEKLEKWYQEVE